MMKKTISLLMTAALSLALPLSSLQAGPLSIGTVDNALAEDEQALIDTYAPLFTQNTYEDAESGLSITYNLYLPENYDPEGSYPMVVFIGDSSCAGNDATRSLTQGRGALVWASSQWQSAYPTIVAVPTYPETILDDHSGYTTTEYVPLTRRFIDQMCSEYAVDKNRIYGTGQSMGCMTTLILASQDPSLYAGCMFVDGQWDVTTLSGLEEVNFVYFAAEDDTNAWNGAQEVMSLFDTDSVSYSYAQWDGNASVDQLTQLSQDLFTQEENQYFISWATGTIDASTANMGGMGGPQGEGGQAPEGMTPPEDGQMPQMNGEMPQMNGEMPQMNGEMPQMNGEMPQMNGEMPQMGEGGGMGGSSSYHMASFDYAYNCVGAMEWLFSQGE